MKDEEKIVRLLSFELNGLKNVNHGEIIMPNFTKKNYAVEGSEILGIYGQNGSGKTAVIDSLAFLKTLMCDQSLPKDMSNYISVKQKRSYFSFLFYMKNESFDGEVSYSFSIRLNDEGAVEICSEDLKTTKANDSGKKISSTLISYDKNSESDTPFPFLPQERYQELASVSSKIDIMLAKEIARDRKKSFIFSDKFRKIWSESTNVLWRLIIGELRFYAVKNLFVIGHHHRGVVTMDNSLPLAFRQIRGSSGAVGTFRVSINEPNVIEIEDYNIIKKEIKAMNIVISALVPNLSIKIKEYGPEMTEAGDDGIRFELLSVRNGMDIPLRYESEGIRKIISILSILTAMYNDPSVLLAIDELDAGIYEYLLGEMLNVIDETGKGQLIFTAHNLRPLEILDKNSLVFTTTNPDNRYIRLKDVKQTNNLRDLYFRNINLGGQNEEVYATTKPFNIRKAFRDAGGKGNG